MTKFLLLIIVVAVVLWLMSSNRWAADNIRREAQARSVDAGRLIFAPRVALPAHLGRLALADLVLDTLPYNAHATTCDSLWAGVPVLTRIGNSFAGRVGASVLSAVGLPELITHTAEQYEALALKLALLSREHTVVTSVPYHVDRVSLTDGSTSL